MTQTHAGDQADIDARLELLRGSYAEVLDATKHQDDKIGRLFTGVSFLTAAALATANLGSSKYLSQRYTEFDAPVGLPPLGIVTLAVYLVLVIICVMLLINSLATPLRIPGREPDRSQVRVRYAGDPSIRTSQIYFGQIAKYSVEEWSRKWRATPLELKRELTDSLIKENHNLAVRTQFKYGRTSEAIGVFNLALLFLSLTVVLCATAAAGNGDAVIDFPPAAHAITSSMFGLYLFFQLQAIPRYSRQTVDELSGSENAINAWLRYGLAFAAAIWITALALGVRWLGLAWTILVVAFLAAAGLLLIGAYRASRSAKAKNVSSRRSAAIPGSWAAVAIGAALTVFVIIAANHEASFAAASAASLGWAVFSFISPNWILRQNRLEYAADGRKGLVSPSGPALPPSGSHRQRAK
ncbi:MAG: hypothetical protein J0G30_06375 [Actinomycetales bacterium]|nr:hypothetical protein [Actinomycetales bacterium]